ncbi:hypothetical protein HZA39_00490 [Candidatus Peregrinibacteria bacterium]|nr:hypothetical protein [Candidatus Peregrinibacteria bacterium]
MNYLNFFPLVLLPVFYFGLAMLKPYLKGKMRERLCAICVANGLSWLLLLILWFAGYAVSIELIAIMLGMSISGIMYKLEPVYKNKQIKNFWFVRIILIVGGLYGVFAFLIERLDIFVPIFVFTAILIFIATFLFQGVRHRDVVEEQKQAGREGGIIKKLDDCC